MATNLLLEGDDLEALLIKAHSEAGPSARIVRAEKYRHGGLWGFFARERFEVAVEIPERPEGPGAAFGVPAPAAPPDRVTGRREPRTANRRSARAQAPVPLPPPARTAPKIGARRTPSVRPVGFPAVGAPSVGGTSTATADVPRATASRATASRASASWAAAARTTTDGATADEARPVGAGFPDEAIARMLDAQLPEPGALAAEGILGIAERVSAAERAAARATESMIVQRRADAAPGPEPLRSITLPRGEDPRGELVGATLSGSSRERLAGSPVTRTTGSDPGPTFDDALPAVPQEPALSPPQPSTTRPEFTALLDQLRSGTALPRQRAPRVVTRTLPGAQDPTADADQAPTPTPTTTATASGEADSPPPKADAAAVPETGHTPVARQAPTVPDPELAQEQQAVADRRTLRSLGVPTAWTRRLRPGDRFTEVLRMLERMPEPEIDPETRVVAVVGPAPWVRLEAHRLAIDLAVADEPRPVIVVPATTATSRTAAITLATRGGAVILAVESSGDDAPEVQETLVNAGAGAVIVVVDARVPQPVTQRWVDVLGHVDALTVEGATTVEDPAVVLGLGLPVIRLDGIPLDRVTWTAVLCAHLSVAGSRPGRGR